MVREYLRNIAVQRVAAKDHYAVDAIQLRVVSTPITAPAPLTAGARPAASPPSSTRYMPWWQVTQYDH